jgi:hypothetical protein
MPSYIAQALQRFNHPHPLKAQHAPHAWSKPYYSSAPQLTADPDVGRPFSPAETTTLQQIIGVLLYYGRAIDSSILVALGTLASAQTKATTSTTTAALQLLDYLATHTNATVRYQSSAMILCLHSDASYLSESESRSRAGGIAFITSRRHCISQLSRNSREA